MKFSKQFEEFRKFLDSIPRIHLGGCAVSALAMFLYLKQEGVESEVRLLEHTSHSDWSTRFNGNYFFILGSGKTFGAGHVVLKLPRQDFYFDARGNYTAYELVEGFGYEHIFTQVVDTEAYLRSAILDSTWNDSFEFSKYLPVIENKLGFSLCLTR